jgi:hypothetical protein
MAADHWDRSKPGWCLCPASMCRRPVRSFRARRRPRCRHRWNHLLQRPRLRLLVQARWCSTAQPAAAARFRFGRSSLQPPLVRVSRRVNVAMPPMFRAPLPGTSLQPAGTPCFAVYPSRASRRSRKASAAETSGICRQCWCTAGVLNYRDAPAPKDDRLSISGKGFRRVIPPTIDSKAEGQPDRSKSVWNCRWAEPAATAERILLSPCPFRRREPMRPLSSVWPITTRFQAGTSSLMPPYFEVAVRWI